MYFAIERINRIVSELGDYIYTDKKQLDIYKMKSCDYGDFSLLNTDSADWESYRIHDNWGSKDKHYWFKTTIEIPKEFDGETVVYRVFTGRDGWDAINPQFLVFINGKAVQGLDVNHREVLLAEKAIAGDLYNIDLYAYTGMNEGYLELDSSVCILQKKVERLYYNILVPVQVAALLDEQDKKRIDILNYLIEAINNLDLRQVRSETFNASVDAVNRYLDEEFYGKFCGDSDVTEICVGHTHIDVAWLWTLAQTREKAARSFSTVLNLMKQYPNYVFMSSQPQLYKYIKEDHPEIYEEIKKMIKAGRWEAEGAMWLEADCNLTSGESLVRQILFGTRFFKQEFGVDNKILWLPDVFGYSAALPQILKKSGIDYFMTTKISWNEFNKMPYDTFMWQGIDGTEILTYFVSTQDYDKDNKTINTTYNGNTNPSQVMGCWQRYQQKEINTEVLNCFGFGDGGGGPTKEMLEYTKRLGKGIPGSPQVKLGNSLDFFKKLEKKVAENKRLPKWVGELYLEYHRGTYTTMARNKRYNRKTEFLNQDVEWLSSIIKTLLGAEYPQKEINECWETTLLNQFHDIIPGSSIKEVYEDSKAQYEKIGAVGRGLLTKAINGVASQIKSDHTSVVVFNQLGFLRSDIVEFALPDGWSFAEVYDENCKIAAQLIDGESIIFFAKNVPAKGYKSFTIKNAAQSETASTLKMDDKNLENKYFTILLDENGNFSSIYDKINAREILQKGKKGNLLQAFEDKPLTYDAWDINIYYQEKMWEINDLTGVQVTEAGPVRSALKINRKFLDSTIEQTIYLYNDINRIDFDNTIDWKEKQILLKAAFPVDIHADKATYEIQYGNVERPTHWNTSWDRARFEVCGHKWADLSEGGYGVSLLNDCKYGHDIKDSVMRLTLLKSSTNPNVDADRETHRFIYSLYPHVGDWKTAGVTDMAYKLNCPMYAKVEAAHDGSLPAEFSFVSLDRDNVMIEVVKKAEDSDDTIVRLYEYKNERATIKLTCCKPLVYAAECDLMENETDTIKVEENTFDFEIKPYEIKTFKIRFQAIE